MSEQHLGKVAFKGTIFVALNTYGNVVINFVTGVLLRKLFIPAEAYGLDALARFFLELYGRLREFGFESAVVHRQTDVQRVFSTFFILQLGIGVLNLVLIVVSYPLLSYFYPDQPLLPLLLIIYGTFAILKGLYSVQETYLRKHLLFRYIATYDVISLLLASILGVITASWHWGVWSLVILNNSYLLFNFIFVWVRGEWQLNWGFDREIAKWFFKFGFFLWIGAITTFVLYRYNDFVIGSLVGLAALGFYTTALSYAQMPTSLVTSIVSRVAFPLYARLQDDPEKLAFTYNFVLKNIVRFSVPITLVLFLTADDFVILLLNEQWRPVIPIFKFLVLYSLLKPIFEDTGAFLSAIGKPRVVSFYISLQAGILLLLSPLMTKMFNAEGAALAVGMAMLLGVALAYYYVSKYVKIHYWDNFAPTFLISAVVTICYFVIDHLIIAPFLTSNVWLSFGARIGTLGVLYILFYILFELKSLIIDINYLKQMRTKE